MMLPFLKHARPTVFSTYARLLSSTRLFEALKKPSTFCFPPSVTTFTSHQLLSKQQSRMFFNKPIPPDAVFPVLFGVGFLAVTLGIGWWIRRQETQYCDPNYHPVYAKNSASSGQNNASIVSQLKRNLPDHVQHVIIGAGAAAMSAARAIRASDPLARVLMISGDASTGETPIPESGHQAPPPYIRPLLSKGLWWRKPERRNQMITPDGNIRKHSWLFYEPSSYFVDPEKLSGAEYGGVSLLHGSPVKFLDPDKHQVTLTNGHHITYDCCLIATGSQPRSVPELEVCSLTGVDLLKHKRVTYFRNLADYRYLQALSDKLHKSGGKIAVIGGGLMGSELAVSIAGESKPLKGESKEEANSGDFSVIHFVREKTPMSRLLPPSLATSIAEFESSKGVLMQPLREVARIRLEDPKSSPQSGKLILTVLHKPESIGSGFEEESILVDHVVCAVGVSPRTDLAAGANLELDTVNGGFLVNSEMEARADVYVAGDAASYWDSTLNCRRRAEHINFAEEYGALAGMNMAAAAAAASSSSPVTIDDEDDFPTPVNKIYDPRSAAHMYQPSFWCSLGTGAAWDAVGLIDSQNLITRSFLVEGTPQKGVVFYLTPKERRLVGILLWNLSDDLYTDTDYAAPSRLNLARKMLLDKFMAPSVAAKEVEALTRLALQFDIGGEVADSWAELKAFTEAKRKEVEEEALISASEAGQEDNAQIELEFVEKS